VRVDRAAAAGGEEREDRGERLGGGVAGSPNGLSAFVVASRAAFGGGTSPEKLFDSRAVALTHRSLSADELTAHLRSRRPPVVARVEGDRVLLDLRSIRPDEDRIAAAALSELAAAVR
jgi:L-seryl-tRNA(Ser) seleniumtransferase